MKAYIDGNAICIVKDDFVNLQESDAYFIQPEHSDTIKAEAENLNKMFAEDSAKARETLIDTTQACLEAAGINFDDLDAAQALCRTYGTKPSHTIKARYERLRAEIEALKKHIQETECPVCEGALIVSCGREGE